MSAELPAGFILVSSAAPARAPAADELPPGFSLVGAGAPKAPSELPEITDPSNPARHGGRFVTGLVDAVGGSIASALTLPGDVATGKVELGMPSEGRDLSRVADLAMLPSALGTGFARGAGQAVANRVAEREVGQLAPALARATGPEVVEAGSRIGVQVPRAVASDSALVQGLGAGVRNVPLAGAPMMAAAERTIGQLGEAAGRVSEGFGGASVPAAGGAAREALEVGWKGRTTTNQERLYGRVDDLVNPNTTTPLEGTRGVVSEILASRAASRVPDGAGPAVTFVADAVKDAKGLTYEGIKDLRTMVGEKLKDKNALAAQGVSEQEMKAIYGGLSNDLRAAVEAGGGKEGLSAFNAANAYTAAVKGRERRLQDIVGAKSDEAVLERLQAAASAKGQRADVELLTQSRKAIGPEAWDGVAGAVVGRLGRDQEGKFSPDRFLTDFGKLSPEGKALLFNSTGKGDLARALTDIATVSSRFKELNKLANPSGTGRAAGFTAGGYGAAVDPVTTLGVALGANVLSRILAAPATASSAAKWAQAYEKVALSPTTGSAVMLQQATKNFIATARSAGLPVTAESMARASNEGTLKLTSQ